jgi:ribosomal protein L14
MHAYVRVLRIWIVAGAVALIAAAPGAAAARQVDRGLVLRVRPPLLALRELDGTRMRFEINASTIVKLNGRRVHLGRLRRGDVAMVVHDADFVYAVRAFRP